MSRIPSEREVLRGIYEMYESSYPGRPPAGGRGENDPYVAIDLSAVEGREKREKGRGKRREKREKGPGEVKRK